jgi:hypothetical protein
MMLPRPLIGKEASIDLKAMARYVTRMLYGHGEWGIFPCRL